MKIHGSDTLLEWRETGFSWKNHGCDDGGGVLRSRAEKFPLGKTRVDAPFGIFERRGEAREERLCLRVETLMNELKICRDIFQCITFTDLKLFCTFCILGPSGPTQFRSLNVFQSKQKMFLNMILRVHSNENSDLLSKSLDYRSKKV